MEAAHGLMKATLSILQLIVGCAETGTFRFLIGKRLGCTETGKTGFDLLIDIAGFFLGRTGCLRHGAAHGHNNDQEYRDRQRHHNCQPPLDLRHNHQRTDDGQHRGQQILRAMVGKLHQLKKVRCQPAH